MGPRNERRAEAKLKRHSLRSSSQRRKTQPVPDPVIDLGGDTALTSHLQRKIKASRSPVERKLSLKWKGACERRDQGFEGFKPGPARNPRGGGHDQDGTKYGVPRGDELLSRMSFDKDALQKLFV